MSAYFNQSIKGQDAQIHIITPVIVGITTAINSYLSNLGLLN